MRGQARGGPREWTTTMHHAGGGGGGGGGGGVGSGAGGTGYGGGPQERVHQAPRSVQPDPKCPYETYQAQIPDCCAAAVAAQDPYPRPPSGYDARCYDECHRRTPFQEEPYSQVCILSYSITLTIYLSSAIHKCLRITILLDLGGIYIIFLFFVNT